MAARPAPEPRLRFTIRLAGRDETWPALTRTEARAMLALGFRFSIYDERADDYRLSIPYVIIRSFDRDTVTFEQD